MDFRPQKERDAGTGREKGKDAFGAVKIAKQAIQFRDRILPILVKGQYYDLATHKLILAEASSGKKPDIIDAYEAQEKRDIEFGVKAGGEPEELRRNELKAARVGLSTLFIAEIFAQKREALTLANSQGDLTGLRYEVKGLFGKKMVDLKESDFTSLSPKDCMHKLKFSIAYTYQEAVRAVFDGHRKQPESEMAQALKLYEHVLRKTEPVKKKTDQELTPELHVIRGLSTSIIEILSLVEHIADRMERGAKESGKKLTVEMVAEVVNNSYETIRKLAQIHIQTLATEQKVFHLEGNEMMPLDGKFFTFEIGAKDNKNRLVMKEDAVAKFAEGFREQLFHPDFKDGVTGCPAMLAESLENANVVEEAYRVFVQKAIELYLPTRFKHQE